LAHGDRYDRGAEDLRAARSFRLEHESCFGMRRRLRAPGLRLRPLMLGHDFSLRRPLLPRRRRRRRWWRWRWRLIRLHRRRRRRRRRGLRVPNRRWGRIGIRNRWRARERLRSAHEHARRGESEQRQTGQQRDPAAEGHPANGMVSTLAGRANDRQRLPAVWV
jgi:hypothetical protein